MQGEDQKINLSVNKNSGYTKLADDSSPYFNQAQPVIIDDAQPHYGQPLPYNQGYQNQGNPYNNNPILYNHGFNNQGFNNQGFNNQGFNNQGFNNQGFNNQGFNNQGFNGQGLENSAQLMKNASQLKCLCLTAIIEDVIYIMFQLIQYGWSFNYVFVFMAVEIIVFTIFLIQIKDSKCQASSYSSAHKFYVFTCVMYFLYFFIVFVLLLTIGSQVDVNLSAVIAIYIVSSLFFLVPRFVALCIASRKHVRPIIVVANR